MDKLQAGFDRQIFYPERVFVLWLPNATEWDKLWLDGTPYFWANFIFILQVSAMIIAAFASGGAALIAKIFLALVGAVRLVKKIAHVIKLEEIETSL